MVTLHYQLDWIWRHIFGHACEALPRGGTIPRAGVRLHAKGTVSSQPALICFCLLSEDAT